MSSQHPLLDERGQIRVSSEVPEWKKNLMDKKRQSQIAASGQPTTPPSAGGPSLRDKMAMFDRGAEGGEGSRRASVVSGERSKVGAGAGRHLRASLPPTPPPRPISTPQQPPPHPRQQPPPQARPQPKPQPQPQPQQQPRSQQPRPQPQPQPQQQPRSQQPRPQAQARPQALAQARPQAPAQAQPQAPAQAQPASLAARVQALHSAGVDVDIDAPVLTPRSGFRQASNFKHIVTLQRHVRVYCARQERARLHRRRKQRAMVVQELLSSERSYVDSLERVDEHFVRPLMWNAKTSQQKILPEPDIARTFGATTPILNFSRELLAELDKRIGKEWHNYQLLGDILEKHAPFMVLYSVYCDNYEPAQQHLAHLKDTLPLFNKWLEQADHLHHLDVNSLLIMPVQRLPRYKLLLEDISRLTEPEHPDARSLRSALQKIAAMADKVNRYIKQSDTGKRMVMLGAKMRGLGEDLVQPHRNLVLEATLSLHHNRTTVPHAFLLFTDILVIVEETDLQGDVLTVRHTLQLWECRVKECADTKYLRFAFQIVGRNRSHVIVCKSKEEENSWMGTLREMMEAARERGQRRPSAHPNALEKAHDALLDANPFIVKFLHKCVVSVAGSELVHPVGAKPFTLYLVSCETDRGFLFHLHKRFSDFDTLSTVLRKKMPNINLPKLPPRYFSQAKNLSDKVIGERLVLLDEFLQNLILEDALQHSVSLHSFLSLTPLDQHEDHADSPPPQPSQPPALGQDAKGEDGRAVARRGDDPDPRRSSRVSEGGEREDGVARRLEVVLADGTTLPFEVPRSVFVNELHELVSETCRERWRAAGNRKPNATASTYWNYRLCVVVPQGSPVLLEDRDRVWDMLDVLGSEKLQFSLFALPITAPSTEPAVSEELAAAMAKVQSNELTLALGDMFSLVSFRLLLTNPSTCRLVVQEGDIDKDRNLDSPALKEFGECVQTHLPPGSLDKLGLEDWAVSVFRIVRKELLFSQNRGGVGRGDGLALKRKTLKVFRKYPSYTCQLFRDLGVRSVAGQEAKNSLEGESTVHVGIGWDGVKLLDTNRTMQQLALVGLREVVVKCDHDHLTLRWGDDCVVSLSTLVGHRVAACYRWFLSNLSKVGTGVL